ncbi:MAG TPA: fibrobacter succinogenes major paralogous domain-containing protein [Bacteroidales bacterium]|nr:fibrobacter succinogenes major paralogous domain-containing protein [Bacteroidales bacterium]
MKRTITLLFAAFMAASVIAQAPQKMSYQAVIRNTSNQLVVNHSVGMRISILKETATGTVVYTETHTVTSNGSGIVTVEIGAGTPVTGTFAAIDWSTGKYFVKTETDPEGGTSYSVTGTSQLLSVPYALRADKATSAEKITGSLNKLEVAGQTDNYEEALFEVKNKTGQTVFAVYNEGVRIFVDNGSAKGAKGGFAIGGFGSSKADPQNYFVVNPDSIRAYVNADPAAKGAKGGFAIGGFGSSKTATQDYLVIHPDSIRMYVNADATVKGAKGGFAIGGFGSSKAAPQEYLIINPDSIRMYVDTYDAAKGAKGGFAIGGFGSSKSLPEEYLRVTRDSTRVYLNNNNSKGKKGGFAVGGFGGAKGSETDYLFLNSDSTRFYVRNQGDFSSSFDIIGYGADQLRKSLFQADPDTVNIQGVLNVQNNLVVAGNVETQGAVVQVGSLSDASGNTYKTVKIGIDEWMAENLKTTKYNDGSDIPNVTDNTAWGLLSSGAYSEYNNDPLLVNTYGRLYNWHAVNTNLLCPTGWHVPTDTEWANLSMYLTNNNYGYFAGSPEIAKSMASTTLWAATPVLPGPGNAPETNNTTGFNGLPAGQRNFDGTFTGLTQLTMWWSISSGGSFDAFSSGLVFDQGMLMTVTNQQVSGFSIRCMKGEYNP